METPEQRKDRERLRKYIRRENLSPVLNDTKWKELYAALSRIAGWVEFRRKDVQDADDSHTDWCNDIFFMMGGWKNIEWLDIKAQIARHRGALIHPLIEDHTEDLMDALKSVGIPYSRTDAGVRIWGYIRPGSSPKWVE